MTSGSWAPTTIRQTRSVVDRYLHPQVGGIRWGISRRALSTLRTFGCGSRVSVVGRGVDARSALGQTFDLLCGDVGNEVVVLVDV